MRKHVTVEFRVQGLWKGMEHQTERSRKYEEIGVLQWSTQRDFVFLTLKRRTV